MSTKFKKIKLKILFDILNIYFQENCSTANLTLNILPSFHCAHMSAGGSGVQEQRFKSSF